MNDIVTHGHTLLQVLLIYILNHNIWINNVIYVWFSFSATPQDKEDQARVIGNLKSISMSSSKLLLAAKALSADPTAPNIKNQLAAAARYISSFYFLKQTHPYSPMPLLGMSHALIQDSDYLVEANMKQTNK